MAVGAHRRLPQGKGAAARLQQAAAPGAAELAALEASSSSDGDSLAGSDSDADSEERMRCGNGHCGS